jgi:transcriptional regulator with XRE-family HTH domain
LNLGTILRKNRKEKKLTLKMVGEKAGISEGFLSQIENNVNSPSINTFTDICNAIGINAGEVLTQVENHEKLVLIKKSDWIEFDLPRTGFLTRRFFSPEGRIIIDSAVIVLEPGRSIPARKGIKNSQEVLCVLKGEVELTHEDHIIVMTEGDSVHYWTAPDRQMITNKGQGLSIILWVATG